MTAPKTRRLATLGVIAAAAIGLTPFLGTPAQGAATPTNVGLYGSTDPTYDGVFRQSLAILGLHAAGKTPDPTAINWLLDQQCADGGFSVVQPNARQGMSEVRPLGIHRWRRHQRDLPGLAGAPRDGPLKEAAKAAKVLRGAQDKDGGWPFIVGGGSSDPNSTGSRDLRARGRRGRRRR